MSVTYCSMQDFYTKLATIAKPYVFTRGSYVTLGRTLASENQSQFECYLHDSMGWKLSTVDDWQA